MTFTTLALIGMGMAGAAAGTAVALSKRKGTAATSTQVGNTQGGRRNPQPGDEFTGDKAISRSDYEQRKAQEEADALNPPSTAALASASTTQAYSAGVRARKRAAAGGTLLNAAQKGQPGPKGTFTPKTLLGS